MKRTLNRAIKLNKTCEITTCVSRDWPPCIRLFIKFTLGGGGGGGVYEWVNYL